MSRMARLLRRVAYWLDPHPDAVLIETSRYKLCLPRGTTLEQALAIMARMDEFTGV